VSGYRRFFRLPFRQGSDASSDLDEEIRTHIALREEALIRRGLGPEEARAEAVRRFGGDRAELLASARARDATLQRRARFDTLYRDVVLAARHARRSPGYTALTLATLGLGIGLTTAVFTLVDRVVLRDLPFFHPQQLVALRSTDSTGAEVVVVSSANWIDWKEQSETLEATAIHFPRRIGIASGEDAFRVAGQVVSSSFFDVLRVPMLVGRPFTEDDLDAGESVAVVSEGLWRRAMGANPNLSTMLIEGRPVRVVGVVPAGLEYPTGTELWQPRDFRPQRSAARNNVNWLAIARLRDGVSIGAADAELDRIAFGIRARDPDALYSYGVTIVPLKTVAVGNAGRYLTLLMVAVALVLLLACANLAGLNFARGTARAREMATRVALGASRGRIIRQLVTEHLVLALAGGVLGTGLALVAIRLAVGNDGSVLPRTIPLGLDWRVVAFGLLVSVLAGLLAGLAPAIRASRSSLVAAMGQTRGAVRGGRNLPGALLVGCEIALAVLLLIGGGLLVRSFGTLVSRDLGFDPHGVATVEIALQSPRYQDQPERWITYWNTLLDQVASIPDIGAVGLANWIPASLAGATFVELEGRSEKPAAGYRLVSDDYFRALGMPLMAGRFFGPEDADGTMRTVIVSRDLADRFWPGEDPIGQRLRALSMEALIDAPWLTVIGVVGDTRQWGFEADTRPEMYALYRQVPSQTFAMSLVVRSRSDDLSRLTPILRQRVSAVDPTLAADIGSLEERVDALVSDQHLLMTVLTGFAVLAVVLAAAGVFGLMSFAVAQRTQEIAVRTALGARRSTILMMVIVSAVRVAAFGTAIGVLGAYWSTRLMTALLVDISATDPVAFLVAATMLLAVSAAAALIPAWRAARLQPVQALRAM
jgi:putative ABC transport system permease protein